MHPLTASLMKWILLLCVLCAVPAGSALACSRTMPSEKISPEIDAIFSKKMENKALTPQEQVLFAEYEKDEMMIAELSESILPACTFCPSRVPGNTCKPGIPLCGPEVATEILKTKFPAYPEATDRFHQDCLAYSVTRAKFEEATGKIRTLKSKWYIDPLAVPAPVSLPSGEAQ